MIGDVAKRLIIEDGINTRTNPHIILDGTMEFRLPCEKNGDLDSTFFYTFGHYSIEFRPKTFCGKLLTPYLISCDLFKGSRVRVGDYESLKSLENENKKVYFLIHYTTMSAKLFKIAKNNPYTKIPFTLKLEKIYDILKAKAKAKGISDNTPLLSENERLEVEEARRAKQKMVQRAKGDMTSKWLQQ